MDTDTTDVVRRFYEAWGRQDLDTAAALMTEDFVNNSSHARGRDSVREEGAFWFAAFPDAEVAIEDLIADGDKVVARIHATATHLGDFLGTAPTGRTVELDEIDIFRVEGGAIAESWSIPDVFGLMTQIGALEHAGAA
ncbi:ester cyclase [Agromyces sp. SYSU T00266]|uniref:ester cyclase n=1 Tax=Agromyces zhanjiangensis TaxID=3158562 RepID=UPI003390C117